MRSASWLVVGLTGGVLVAGGVLLGVQGLGTQGTAAASTPAPVRTATTGVEPPRIASQML